ncbi:MAG: hypothetical protein LBI33_14225, partial [Propionibacteriaceae bacterium]|nr:hypothetical protein [Propionibacteriaceae bacterium]
FQHLPQNTLEIAKLATVIGSVGAVAGAALGSVAPIGGAIADIGPAALFAVPALGGLAATAGTLVMAFKGFSTSVVPNVVAFRKEWDTFTAGLKGIQGVVQREFFSQAFTESFTRLSDFVLPELEYGLTGLGRAYSIVATDAMDAWRNALDDQAIRTFFDQMRVGLLHSNQGIQDFVTGLTNLGTQGADLFPRLGNWVTDVGGKFRAWTERNNLAQMMHEGAIQAGYLMDAVGNLGGIIAGVFRSFDTGRSAGLASFAETTGKIRDIVNSASFQDAMHTVFAGAADGAAALRDVLGPVGSSLEKLAPLAGEFFRMAATTGADALDRIAGALAQDSTQGGLYQALYGMSQLVTTVPWDTLGAALGAIGGLLADAAPLVSTILTTTAPLLPKIVDAASALFDVGDTIVSGLLPPAVDLTAKLLDAAVPLAPVIVAVGIAFGTWKLATIIDDAMSLSTYFKVLRLEEMGPLAAASGALKEGIGGVGLALKSLVTNPVVLALTAVTAAVGIGLTAWNNYKEKQREAKQHVDELTASLDENTGALTENSFEVMLKNIKELEAANGGYASGIKTTTDAYNALKDAMGDSVPAWGELGVLVMQGKDAVNEYVDSLQASIQAQYANGELSRSESTKLLDSTMMMRQALLGEADAVAASRQQHQENVAALEVFNGAQVDAAAATTGTGNALLDYYNSTTTAAEGTAGLAGAVEDTTDKMFSLTGAARDTQGTIDNYYNTLNRATDASKANTTGLDGNSQAARDNRDAVDDIFDATETMIGSMLQSTMTVDEQKAAVEEARQAFITQAQTLGIDAVRAQQEWDKNIGTATGALYDQMAQTQANEAATKAFTDAVTAVAGRLTTYEGQTFKQAAAQAKLDGTLDSSMAKLYDLGGQAGLTRDEVDKYAGALRNVPDTVAVKVKQEGAEAAYDAITKAARDRWATIHVAGVTQGGQVKATGGSVWGPGTSTSDSIAAWLSNGEFVTRTAVANRWRWLLDYLNKFNELPKGLVPGFASGGSVTVPDYRAAVRQGYDEVARLLAAVPASMPYPVPDRQPAPNSFTSTVNFGPVTVRGEQDIRRLADQIADVLEARSRAGGHR